MRVIKRDNRVENVSLDNILYRLKGLSTNAKELRKLGLTKLENIDPDLIAMDVVGRLYDKIPTTIIDEEAARISNSKTEHPEYGVLALRIIVNNHHRNTEECFSEVMEKLWDTYDELGNHNPITSESYMELVRKHKNELNEIPDYTLDYSFDYIGFQQLYKSYLLKKSEKVGNKTVLRSIERPQHMYLRVALTLYKDNLEKVKEAYEYLSKGLYTQASPTLFNCGTKYQSMSSCYLLYMEDSLEGIFKTITDTALISKRAGGLGVPISNIRAKGSLIRGTNGPSDGIIPMMQVYNQVGKYVNQGGRRKGAVALYIEPYHADIIDFLHAKKAQTHEDMRAKDIFLALWIPDLFMKQVKSDGDWWLMCPDKSPGLVDSYGEEFEKRYWAHVEAGNFIKKVKAQDIWTEIMNSQMESGTPYLLYKDAVNRKSNQSNIGMIKSSNLCVHPDTKVLTDKGHITISELGNKTVRVWNGKEFSRTTVYKTGENKSLLKVHFDIGNGLVCTPEHKFYVECGGTSKETRAKDLKEGDKLTSYKLPLVQDRGKLGCLQYGLTTEQTATVTSVEFDHTIADTYCFNEPKEHRGVFNGYLTGQCSEIVLYSDEKEYGTCNLESIALPKFVTKVRKNAKPQFDHEFLHTVVKNTIESMNSVIDNNYYPIPETERSNKRHRPIGVGVQGLHDTYIKMRFPFDSEEAKRLNIEIFETIYHACLEGSMELAKRDGAYSTFQGSPMSQGKLQFDLWKEENPELDLSNYLSKRYDWDKLKRDIQEHGIRNSMLTTCMPTVSTAQILNNTEAIEPFDSCIFKRRTIAGEFTVVYKYLVNDLIELGLWSTELKNTIIREGGSIQNISGIPDDIKKLYKTAWEISQRVLIDQSADRGLFIDHTQSLNLFVAQPTYKNLSSMHMYGWQKGLKTGLYYLRSKPQTQSANFAAYKQLMNLPPYMQTKEPLFPSEENTETVSEEALLCSLVNRDECTMCSS